MAKHDAGSGFIGLGCTIMMVPILIGFVVLLGVVIVGTIQSMF